MSVHSDLAPLFLLDKCMLVLPVSSFKDGLLRGTLRKSLLVLALQTTVLLLYVRTFASILSLFLRGQQDDAGPASQQASYFILLVMQAIDFANITVIILCCFRALPVLNAYLGDLHKADQNLPVSSTRKKV